MDVIVENNYGSNLLVVSYNGVQSDYIGTHSISESYNSIAQ